MCPFAQRTRRTSRAESGAAMMMALAVVAILSLITLALTNLAISEYSTATAAVAAMQAFLAAEAGGERAVAFLRADADWGDNVTTLPFTPLFTNEPFPGTGSSLPAVGQFSVLLGRPPAGYDPQTNSVVRSMGTFRGVTRVIQFTLHRMTGADYAFFAVDSVDISSIPGGGSLQFHGSAYFVDSLILKGSSGAGLFNDRKLFESDPGYMNHLYVAKDLDVSTGNPTIGSPYWYVHVKGAITGWSANVTYVQFDKVVPSAPLYPDVTGAVKSALADGGNLLRKTGQMDLVICRRQGSSNDWQPEYAPNLLLTSGNPYFLPRADKTCSDYKGDNTAIRSSDVFMLLWDPNPAPGSASNLVLKNPDKPIYVPGTVGIGVDVRYEGKGTVVVANDPSYIDPTGNATSRSGCAWDFNYDPGKSCKGDPSTGRTLVASISPCNGAPGTDNPKKTFPTQDLMAFVVNGGAYSNLNASACGQEMNFAGIVGDINGSACFEGQKKLQIYGFLMTKCLGLGQVPDFWQMPDMISLLPKPMKNFLVSITNPVLPWSWQELF